MSTPVSFADLGVPEQAVKVLASRNITEPTPIQAATLPDSLAGLDVCGRAPTGSGKTLAFGLAAVINTKRATPRKPRALILVPTRELALQVEVALHSLAQKFDRNVISIYGGTGYDRQRKAFRNAVDIVVACPGRLEDLIEQGDVDLRDVDFVAIDEADRMADMGFLPAVKRLLDATKKDRQTLLFSATLDGEVDVLIKKYQRDPKRHDVAAHEDSTGDVKHEFWKIDRNTRAETAARAIVANYSGIVFCRTKHGSDRLVKQLAAFGVKSAAIHGDRSQKQREAALQAFKNNKVQALVATDVAARGIHVDAVPCVIHFDPVEDPKDYVHRSGRTGRAGEDGLVISLVTDDQVRRVKLIARELKMDFDLMGMPNDLVAVERKSGAEAEVIDLTEPSRARGPRAGGADRSGRSVRKHGGDRENRGPRSEPRERTSRPSVARERSENTYEVRESADSEGRSARPTRVRSDDRGDSRSDRAPRNEVRTDRAPRPSFDRANSRDSRDNRDSRTPRDSRNERPARDDRSPRAGSDRAEARAPREGGRKFFSKFSGKAGRDDARAARPARDGARTENRGARQETRGDARPEFRGDDRPKSRFGRSDAPRTTGGARGSSSASRFGRGASGAGTGAPRGARGASAARDTSSASATRGSRDGARGAGRPAAAAGGSNTARNTARRNKQRAR